MTILLIEDNRLFSELVETNLADIEVHVVETLGAALEWLNTFHADMILVDLGLPDSSGLNTLKALRHIKTPKIVVTGADESPEQAAQLGATDYVIKADPNRLIKRLRFHISRLSKKPRFAPGVFEEIRACLEHRDFVMMS